ncbi:unnamed protein product [Didymodactylos carnosus]|uniref:Ubiquitin-like domain-containing protein n=1 Tax=Didymodactylos carnosus TaxID=1234261 RepID=A0A815DV72_9BILA|nr:unnamed protein product [Didymodactylos carnosus]CAF1398102.1 unnamed protein product [Didymodactylos carnosus]CAF4140225.1 unnamed protein product [Didymodactylos carnosus]CAF4205494.1 unnamed protein product [Didymodactylos carnosus]
MLGDEVFFKNPNRRTLTAEEEEELQKLHPVDLFFKISGQETTVAQPLTASFYDKIQDVKKRIEAKMGISVESQRIIFAGKQLEDLRYIGDYGIQKESTLWVVQRKANGT